MNPSQGQGESAPTYAAVLRVPRYLPVFLANALSMWGDYIARVTIAAVVYERTRSPLATATTLAVSLVPTFFGRSLIGPVVDRFPYKWVLIWSHLLRAACVLGLMWLVLQGSSLWLMFLVLFGLELIGGASTASYMVLVTDLFDDRHLYARAVGLGAMSEQFNQAIGLAVGGGLIVLVGPETGLLFDLLTFVVAALVTLFVVELRPVSGERGRGLRGFTRDLTTAAGDLARHPVLARLVTLSAVACLGIVAPEALALPIAGRNGWGGVLMASPIVGAVVGIILIGRRDVHQQNRSIVPLALAMPIPLLLIAVEPPIWLVAALFFVSGMMQAFMVPLQATFALVTEPALRGRIFSLAGSVSIAAAGLSYLAAGWVGQHSSAYLAVTICAGVCLALVSLIAATWPHSRVRSAVDSAYATTSSRAA
ncbi:MFS transporter [Terrabacter sp. Root85]|uniref:MFS transporter n=1 Tax=Terrabacter sp. Root85 TaxID=1736603 RepID=UPI0006F97C2A|nr:MFS transporter [Terrabacter sp. Root85]KRC89807.1 MFS transporter [Terrabacter sp. Root85]